MIQLRTPWTVRRWTLVPLILAAACSGSPTAPPPPVPAFSVACPAGIQTASVGGEPVTITYPDPATSGGSAPLTVTCAPVSGTVFSPGATPVTCEAIDATGRRASCGFSVSITAVPRLRQTRFMTFGDSLTEGKISLTPFLLIDSPAHSYPAKLQALLSERYPGQQVTVLNEGFGGERAGQSTARFDEALSTHRPGAVLLMHGVNDLNGSAAGRIQSAVDGVEELVKAARGAGVDTFVATLPPLGPPKGSCPECVEPFNQRLRDMVAAKGAVLVDVHAAWGNQSGLMGADGIHPTEAGYEVIARAFFEAIQRTLELPIGGA